MQSPARPKPLRPSRKRTQTVARLIEAANAVIAEKGFQSASMDEIAARAGVTKGSIYSNFASKEALFLAVVGSRQLTVPFQCRLDQPLRASLRATAEAFCANLPQARAHSAFMAEFILYALTHEGARERWAQWYARQHAHAPSPALEAYVKAAGHSSFRTFSVILQAQAFGLYFQHAISPELVTNEVIIAAFEALAEGPESRKNPSTHRP